MTQTIHITMDEKMAAEIEKRAAASQLSAGTYIQLALLECLESECPLPKMAPSKH